MAVALLNSGAKRMCLGFGAGRAGEAGEHGMRGGAGEYRVKGKNTTDWQLHAPSHAWLRVPSGHADGSWLLWNACFSSQPLPSLRSFHC